MVGGGELGAFTGAAAEIMSLGRHAARTGEPILRALAYHCPVTNPSMISSCSARRFWSRRCSRPARIRTVTMPPGRWRDACGMEVDGPAEIALEVTLESLPWWRRVE